MLNGKLVDFDTALRTPLARDNPDRVTSAKASRASFSRNLCKCQLGSNSRSLNATHWMFSKRDVVIGG